LQETAPNQLPPLPFWTLWAKGFRTIKAIKNQLLLSVLCFGVLPFALSNGIGIGLGDGLNHSIFSALSATEGKGLDFLELLAGHQKYFLSALLLSFASYIWAAFGVFVMATSAQQYFDGRPACSFVDSFKTALPPALPGGILVVASCLAVARPVYTLSPIMSLVPTICILACIGRTVTGQGLFRQLSQALRLELGKPFKSGRFTLAMQLLVKGLTLAVALDIFGWLIVQLQGIDVYISSLAYESVRQQEFVVNITSAFIRTLADGLDYLCFLTFSLWLCSTRFWFEIHGQTGGFRGSEA
jgi:hypothetical protein